MTRRENSKTRIHTFKITVIQSQSMGYRKQCSLDLDVSYRVDMDIQNIHKPHH